MLLSIILLMIIKYHRSFCLSVLLYYYSVHNNFIYIAIYFIIYQNVINWFNYYIIIKISQLIMYEKYYQTIFFILYFFL